MAKTTKPRQKAPPPGDPALTRLAQAGLIPYFAAPTGDFILLEGDCRALLPKLHAMGLCPQLIFADPPYHLSNNGITCRSGRMVSVNKGGWDQSAGIVADHAFVLEWLATCLNALAPGGSLWVSGTHHVIFSVGYGLQELHAKILNVVVWEKATPPPHLACRYYTHSHELILWAKRDEKEKHTFHYAFEKAANGGKQQKDIWQPRQAADQVTADQVTADEAGDEEGAAAAGGQAAMPNHWRLGAPGKAEKGAGKHPTQKPLELLDRIVRCSSNEGDLVVDPFCGSGTTGIAAVKLGRRFIGIEQNVDFLALAHRRYLELAAAD
jgi:site-specific DNA-methyltransferase (adenine-specific)